ncbi:armadillo-like helical domain-containing protein 2 [Pogona vitticeps]
MGNILNKLQMWYDMYIVQVREPSIKLIDPIFHHHKIKTYGNDLRNEELSLEERGRAALHIGLLTYTGGVTAAELAIEYIQDMIDILIMPDTSGKASISVLKGLCGICYLSPMNQNETRENHLAEILISYLDEDEDSPDADPDITLVKFWVCYLMTIVCCNNMPYLKLFNEVGGQMLEKRLESLSAADWFGWPQNYAKIFLIMAYPKMQTDK